MEKKVLRMSSLYKQMHTNVIPYINITTIYVILAQIFPYIYIFNIFNLLLIYISYIIYNLYKFI